MIVCRDGQDLAAVIPLEYLDLLREVVERQEVEKLAGQIDWHRGDKTLRPPQEWFDDSDNPFGKSVSDHFFLGAGAPPSGPSRAAGSLRRRSPTFSRGGGGSD